MVCPNQKLNYFLLEKGILKFKKISEGRQQPFGVDELKNTN